MSKKKIFTNDFTESMAELSRLTLSPDEASYFPEQFNKTLNTIGKLDEVSVKGADEANNITGLINIYRKDEIDTSRILKQKEALSDAKRKYDGFFVVKGVLDEK